MPDIDAGRYRASRAREAHRAATLDHDGRVDGEPPWELSRPLLAIVIPAAVPPAKVKKTAALLLYAVLDPTRARFAGPAPPPIVIGCDDVAEPRDRHRASLHQERRNGGRAGEHVGGDAAAGDLKRAALLDRERGARGGVGHREKSPRHLAEAAAGARRARNLEALFTVAEPLDTENVPPRLTLIQFTSAVPPAIVIRLPVFAPSLAVRPTLIVAVVPELVPVKRPPESVSTPTPAAVAVEPDGAGRGLTDGAAADLERRTSKGEGAAGKRHRAGIGRRRG